MARPEFQGFAHELATVCTRLSARVRTMHGTSDARATLLKSILAVEESRSDLVALYSFRPKLVEWG